MNINNNGTMVYFATNLNCNCVNKGVKSCSFLPSVATDMNVDAILMQSRGETEREKEMLSGSSGVHNCLKKVIRLQYLLDKA